jgi:multiple sugar transport system substrate-binding protein
MLYWRTDLMPKPPATFGDLVRASQAARQKGKVKYGYVWQGARYEGLVVNFFEYLGAHGGRILDGGRVTVNSPPALAALNEMQAEIYGSGIVPSTVLTWHEEESRFAFQNGEAAFMRNWPYPVPLLRDPANSRVAGKFAVAPLPATPQGTSTSAIGGAQLAINRHTEHPEAAWEVIHYLTQPEQMLERARVVGQFPTRSGVYDDPGLASALALPPATVKQIIEHAAPRPVTPVYTQLSEILQIQLHRALTRQTSPADALAQAQQEMQRVLDRAGLGAERSVAQR